MNATMKALAGSVVLAFGSSFLADGAMAQNAPADFSSLVEARIDGVVTVTGDGGAQGERGSEEGVQGGLAGSSGFFVSRDGLAVAAASALGGASDVSVTLPDGSTVAGEVVGTDEKSGVAVVDVAADGPLPVLPWAAADELALGDWLVALGRPQPGTPTAAVGVVGALPGGMISSALPVTPANIGGPVLNGQGGVVGLATLVAGPNGAPRPAILSATRVQDTVETLLQEVAKRQQPPQLGVAIQPLDRGLARAFGVESGAGVVVAAVEEGSAAAKAGVRPGDVVTGFAGQKVKGPGHLRSLVRNATPGQEVPLTVHRDRKEQTVTVALPEAGTAPAAEKKPEQSAQAAQAAQAPTDRVQLGMRLLPLNQKVASELGVERVDQGVLVMAVRKGAPAAEAGIRPGDIITAVGQKPVASPGAIVSALKSAREAGMDVAPLRVYREGAYQYVSVPV